MAVESEKGARVAATKARANGFFGDGEWREAQEDYAEAVRTLQAGDMPSERRREAWDLLYACWLNEAQCWLKRENWAAAERAALRLTAAQQRAIAAARRHLRQLGWPSLCGLLLRRWRRIGLPLPLAAA